VFSEISGVADSTARSTLDNLLGQVVSERSSNDCDGYALAVEAFLEQHMNYNVDGVLTGAESQAVFDCFYAVLALQSGCFGTTSSVVTHVCFKCDKITRTCSISDITYDCYYYEDDKYGNSCWHKLNGN
jgi:hypothetical protein